MRTIPTGRRRDGPRLAVPGPVWGERPERADTHVPGGHAPRRGPPALPNGPWRALWRDDASDAIDGSAVALRARRLATRLAADRQRRGSRAVSAVVSMLVARGLGCESVAPALALAGATLAATTGLVPRPNQYRCAALLLAQRLVELDTGEGKSVAVALAAAVAALVGAPVHALTANDYLARRDAVAFAPFYAALGLSVAAVGETDDEATRRAAWRADVAYAAAKTLGFDWLRDASAPPGAQPLLRGLCVAIVDEADSILLDEARTPLVIAEPTRDPVERASAWRALDLARRLDPERHIAPDDSGHGLRLNSAGLAALDALGAHEAIGATATNGAPGTNEVPGAQSATATRGSSRAADSPREREAWVLEALTALHRLRRDVDYLVDARREIVLIDGTTGRVTPGRQLSRHLHLLVALKEGVPSPPAMRVSASVTYPALFARYHHVCGTSGTLLEAARELRRHYGLCTERVASHRRSLLRRGPTRTFVDRDTLFDAAVRRAAALAAAGRPVLVGTDSVEDAIALAAAFARAGVSAGVLDARHDADEAARVAAAGGRSRITVTTQRAGRGTDIALAPAALEAGGLHVLNLQHNRSARIDRQLIGRSARRGEPGSAEHWLRADGRPLRDLAPAAGFARRLARHLARRPDETAPGRRARLQGALASLLWRACQAWWRLEDASNRGDALRADRERGRRLAVAAQPISKDLH